MNCYCCSGKDFEICCEPFLHGTSKPITAEALMRSRYSAYATANVDYILDTTHSSTRKHHKPDYILHWAISSTWVRLEIISKQAGTENDKKGTVEFKAYYLTANQSLQVHHELSSFEKEQGEWYFVNGKVKS